MKLKLTDEECSQVQKIAQQVFDSGERWVSEGMHFPAGAIIDAIADMEGVRPVDAGGNCGDGSFSINGWQYDWVAYFIRDRKQYTLSGSGYYGGHAFGLSDEQPFDDDE